jgi:hypothetical protein
MHIVVVLDRFRPLDERRELAGWLGSEAPLRLAWACLWLVATAPAVIASLVVRRLPPILQALVPILVWGTIASLVLLVAWRQPVRRWLVSRGVRRALARIPRADARTLASHPDGARVRVLGRVRAVTGLPERPLVAVSRELAVRGKRREVHERAVDFLLVDETGAEIEVQVAAAALLESSAGLPSWVLRSGDPVEIVGLKQTLSQAAGTGPYRATRVAFALQADPTHPVLVRPAHRE